MDKNNKLVRTASVLIFMLLILQYVLGMILNFFVNLGGVNIQGNSFFEIIGRVFGYARTAGGSLEAHWLNAIILVILAIILLVIGIRHRERWLWLNAGLLIFLFTVAAFSGAAFVGYHNDYFSFIMASAFLVVFAIAINLCFQAFRKLN